MCRSKMWPCLPLSWDHNSFSVFLDPALLSSSFRLSLIFDSSTNSLNLNLFIAYLSLRAPGIHFFECGVFSVRMRAPYRQV